MSKANTAMTNAYRLQMAQLEANGKQDELEALMSLYLTNDETDKQKYIFTIAAIAVVAYLLLQ